MRPLDKQYTLKKNVSSRALGSSQWFYLEPQILHRTISCLNSSLHGEMVLQTDGECVAHGSI